MESDYQAGTAAYYHHTMACSLPYSQTHVTHPTEMFSASSSSRSYNYGCADSSFSSCAIYTSESPALPVYIDQHSCLTQYGQFDTGLLYHHQLHCLESVGCHQVDYGVYGAVAQNGMSSYYEDHHQFSQTPQYEGELIRGVHFVSALEAETCDGKSQSDVPLFADHGPACLDRPTNRPVPRALTIEGPNKEDNDFFIFFTAPQFDVEKMEFEFHEDKYEFTNYDFVINFPEQDSVLVSHNFQVFLDKVSSFEMEEHRREPSYKPDLSPVNTFENRIKSKQLQIGNRRAIKNIN